MPRFPIHDTVSFMKTLLFQAIFIFVFISASLPCFGDLFFLDNGNTIKGTLEKEDSDYYYINFGIGKTRLLKTSVIKIEKETSVDSPEDQLKRLCQKATTKTEFIEAAEFAFSNNLFEKAIFLVKKAKDMDPIEEKASFCEERQKLFEEKYFELISVKTQSTWDTKNYRKSASILQESTKHISIPEIIAKVKNLKVHLYRNLMNEEETSSYLTETINNLGFVVTGTQSSSNPIKNMKETFLDLEETSFKLNPYYSEAIEHLLQLGQLYKYILKNQLDEYAKKNVHSKNELDIARGNPDNFNKLVHENNQIYKALSVIQEFNNKLLMSQNLFQKMQKKTEEENVFWKEKGYEKVNGEWLKGEEALKAKGYIFYRSEWLDPYAPDFELKTIEIDKKIEETPKNKSISPPNSVSEVSHASPANTSESTTTLPPSKAPNSSQTKKRKIRKTYFSETDDSKSEGMPIHLGIGIIAALLFILKISKRKK